MPPELNFDELASPSTRVVAVTGGKGGVGKTLISINLGFALANAGQRVILLDGDLGLSNIDVQLGLAPRYTLEHLLSGERTLAELLLQVTDGLHLVPAASGVTRMTRLNAVEHAAIVTAFAELPQHCDVLLIDTAPGIGDQVQRLSAAASHVLVVLCDDPASLTDAYGLIKVLSREQGVRRFHVLVNRVSQGTSAEMLFHRLQRVTDRYLEVQLVYAGEVPDDAMVGRSVRAQRAAIQAFPGCPASRAIQKLAHGMKRWPAPVTANGRIEFFIDRVLAATRAPRLQVVK
jgi:flagellar biosynthesis protein FlhG